MRARRAALAAARCGPAGERAGAGCPSLAASCAWCQPHHSARLPPLLAPTEYLEVVKDRGLVLRTDVLEVALLQLEAQQLRGQPECGGGGDAV